MAFFIVRMEPPLEHLETLAHFPAMQAINCKGQLLEHVWQTEIGVEEIQHVWYHQVCV